MQQPMRTLMSATIVLAAALAAAPSGAQRAARQVDATRGAILNAAIEAMQREEYAQARATLARIEKDALSPFERSRVEQILFNIAYQEKSYDEARQHLQRAVDAGGLSEPEIAQVQYQQAQLLMTEERWQEGAAALEAWLATAVQPNPAAYYLLAVAYYQSDDYERALPAARAAIDRMQEPKTSWLELLTALHLKQERYQDASEMLSRLISLAPDNKRYWLQLSSAYGQLEDYDSALAAMQLAYNAGLLTESAEILRLADLLLFNGRAERAARLLEEALAANTLPADSALYTKIANAWIEAREFDQAVAPLERAAELAGTGEAYFRLGQLQVQREDWVAAEAALGRAIAAGRGLEKTVEAEFLMGVALFEQGRLRDAKAWFEQARAAPAHRGVSQTYLDLITSRLSEPF